MDCKEDLCDAIRDCDNYTGNLELVNKMHRLLIKHYCKNQSVDLLSKGQFTYLGGSYDH